MEVCMSDNLTVPGDWLSPQQLADWLDIPLKSIYRWNEHGTGPAPTRLGRHIRYSRQAILNFLAAQESAPH
jgi:predicted DNA-binding transcriptional regulator AlpA